MKEQMLFVDDDKVLLDGLRRMLRSMRDEWDMQFCHSAQEALAKMELRCFDVVISDMRMPEIDGAQLLAAVKNKCPHSVRIVLSGQAEIETVLRALTPAHQYIGKPCDPERLKNILQKACLLRRLLREQNLVSFVSQLEMVPVESALLACFKHELEREAPDMNLLGQIVSSDVGLSLKVLQLTDSGFFGARPAIFDPAKATNVLGVELLREISEKTGIFSEHPQSKWIDRDVARINRHSVAVAQMAREMAAAECDDALFQDACYAAGLLHDVGKIVLAAYKPEVYGPMFRRSMTDLVSLEDLERETFGASHSEIGSFLVALWGLPEPLVEAVALHHRPTEQWPKHFGVTAVVHAANGLQDCYEFSDAPELLSNKLPREINPEYVRAVQQEHNVNTWLKAFQSKITRYD